MMIALNRTHLRQSRHRSLVIQIMKEYKNCFFFVLFFEKQVLAFSKSLLYILKCFPKKSFTSPVVYIWALSQERLKPACSATDTRDDSEILLDASLVSLLS